MSSISGRFLDKLTQAAYAASKAGVTMFTRHLALEVGPGFLQAGSHAIELLRKVANLVRRKTLDPAGKIPASDRLGVVGDDFDDVDLVGLAGTGDAREEHHPLVEDAHLLQAGRQEEALEVGNLVVHAPGHHPQRSLLVEEVDAEPPADVVDDAGVGEVAAAVVVEDPLLPVVEHGEAEPLHRLVAIKLLKAGVTSADILGRFAIEKQTLAIMEHPNIATIYDSGTSAKGLPYFTMEYVEGSSLTAYCDERRLGLEERLRLLIQVAAEMLPAAANSHPCQDRSLRSRERLQMRHQGIENLVRLHRVQLLLLHSPDSLHTQRDMDYRMRSVLVILGEHGRFSHDSVPRSFS